MTTSPTTSFGERVMAGVCTHPDVPVRLAAALVEQLRARTCVGADQFVNEHYEQLRGHALDPAQLRFENAKQLRSTLVVANARPGVKWHSFGALVMVTEPVTEGTDVFRRVDFYSVAPRDSGQIYLADVYLRFDVAADGRVLEVDFDAVGDATSANARNAYGTMLYILALALAGQKVESLT